MKQSMSLASAIFIVTLVVAKAASPADDVIANLVVGQCLSEKTGASLPAGSINPRTIGVAVGPNDRDRRLSRQALRIPSASGAVYYDHDRDYCYVHASGVDGARAIARIQEALNKRAFTVGRSIGQYKDRSGVPMRAVIFMLETTVRDPVYVIRITHSLDGLNAFTAGVTVGQEQK